MQKSHPGRWCLGSPAKSSDPCVGMKSPACIGAPKTTSVMLTNTPAKPSRANPARSRLLSIFEKLLAHFGPRKWWPAEAAWEMMVGAILVQNTAWANVQKALAALKSAKVLTLLRIAHLPRRQ